MRVIDIAVQGIDKILNNLAESDFASEHGMTAVKGLREWRLDMASDIAQTILGRDLLDEEGKYLRETYFATD